LGPLEDIGLLVSERVLDVHMTNETFGSSVEVVWKNPEIRKYVAVSRLDDAKCYDKLESLYNAICNLSKC
jgi:hypothetical protein